mmetsp:Transcript_194/g.207  ORF Transcript_194/g.207 Transcript_194/m.207 type:complete len:155 (+) Transcript_194:301-765(+)
MASGVSRTAKQAWHLFDAKGQQPGRLATQIARILIGKHKPIYSPHLDIGDHVVVINARQVRWTGKKYNEKLYRWHTGYPGGLKSTTPRQLTEIKDKPEEIIQNAVSRMLPKNKLRKWRMRKLHVFADDDHIFKTKQMFNTEKSSIPYPKVYFNK